MKFKIKQQGNQTVVRVGIEKNETISEKDIAMIAQYPVKGIFIPQLKRGGMFNKTVIECVAPRSIPLAQYFGNIIQRGHFYFLLAQIVAVVGRLQQRNIPPNNLVLDMRYIFVNPQNHELKFLYIPMVSVRSYAADILGFIKSIVNAAKPSPQENCGYYYEFIDFCSKQKFFSLNAFTQFLVQRDQNASLILRDIMMQSGQNAPNNQQQYQGQYRNQQRASENFVQNQQYMGTQRTAAIEDDERTLLVDEEPVEQRNNAQMTGQQFQQQDYGKYIPPEERGTELLSTPSRQETPEPEYLPEEHLASLPKDKGTVLISPEESEDDYAHVSNFKPQPLIPPIVGFKPAPVNPTPPQMPEVNPVKNSVPELKPEPIPEPKPEVKPVQNPVPELKPEPIPEPKSEVNLAKPPVPEFKPEPIPEPKSEVNLVKPPVPELKPEPIPEPKPEVKPVQNPVPEFKPELIPEPKPEVKPVQNPVPEFKPEPIPEPKPEVKPVQNPVPEFKPEPIPEPKPEVKPVQRAENKLTIPDVTPPPFEPINDYVHYREEDDEEVGGTVLLSSVDNPFRQNVAPKNPRLIRKRNNQEFPINKPVYRVGKEWRFVDGYITGNTAISRTHAEIVTRNNRYFITDLHSTNYTYINHSIIARETETEFYDGDIITLADEDFLFKT